MSQSLQKQNAYTSKSEVSTSLNLPPKKTLESVAKQPSRVVDLPENVQTLLACPICNGALQCKKEQVICTTESCEARFPLADGIPILLNQAKSIFDTEAFLKEKLSFFTPRSLPRRVISRFLPQLSKNLIADRVIKKLRDILIEEQTTVEKKPKILVVGGGILGDGMKPLADDPRVQLVETDVSLAPRTSIICDGHNLPFGDNVFDAVIIQAVLEHVVDPTRCVEEAKRVLRRGGLVYADTPFMQQVHGGKYDFTRFTLLGHRRLFRDFTEIENGISSGPGAALASSARYFALSFFRKHGTRSVVNVMARLSLFWLKYFDPYLIKRNVASDAASGIYFLGRKEATTISDKELIGSYSGGF